MTISAETAELLRQYFIQQRSVNLPGIGGFSINRIPAELDATSGQLKPPSYSVMFDAGQTASERELFAYVSRKKNISEWEAIGVVNSFAGTVRESIGRGEQYEWKGMGLLYPEGDTTNFVPEVKQFRFHPTLSDLTLWKEDGPEGWTPDTKVVDERDHEEAIVEASTGWWVGGVIIAAVALVLIFFGMVANNYEFSTHRQTKTKVSAATEPYIFTPAQ